MKSKIIYVVTIVITLYLTLLYDYTAMRFLMVFMLLLFPVMGIWTLLVGRKVHVSLQMPQKTVFRNEKLSVWLKVKNDSFFPLPEIKVVILEKDRNTGEESELLMDEMADGYEENIFLRDCEAVHCGRCVWHVEQIRVYDYTGLWSRKIRNDDEWEIQILPNIYHMNVEIDAVLSDVYVDEPEYDMESPGDDVSELFQIRAYRPGDSMQRIYWKMTAREDTLMVKDYGKPLETSLILLLDPGMGAMKSYDGNLLDNFLELAASLSATLLEQGCVHQVGWQREDALDIIQIAGEDDFQMFLGKLIALDFSSEHELTCSGYHELYPQNHRNSCYLLNTQLCLFKDDSLLVDFSKIPREEWEGHQVTL